ERVAAPDEPPIRADPRFLRQIIAKLLTNALKFTDKGGIRVETLPLATFNGSTPALALPERFAVPDGEWLALRVADTGVGIKPEHREIIFESFRQADESSIREFGGTGMGLAITRRLVDLHHGFIWVESQPDAGSTFTLLLPVYHPSPRPEHR